MYKHFDNTVSIYMNIAKRKNQVHPKKFTAHFGENVEFTCKSIRLAWWTFNGGSLPTNTFVSQNQKNNINTLKITKVWLSNSGIYTCLVEQHKYLIYEDEGILEVQGN